MEAPSSASSATSPHGGYMVAEEALHCSKCGKSMQIRLQCSKCKQVTYCSAACQRDDWPSHKQSCKKPEEVTGNSKRRDEIDGRTSAAAVESSKGGEKAGVGKGGEGGGGGGGAGGGRGGAGVGGDEGKYGGEGRGVSARRFRLVGVLSSHVGDRNRLERLQSCLESVAGQTQPLAAFFAVWSAPDALAAEVEASLEALAKKLAPAPVRWLRQTKRTSQFYDIRWLHQELLCKEPADTWALFSDDDDLWGPERVRLYLGVIQQYAGTPSVTGVAATHKVRPKSPKKLAKAADEVPKHLASGEAMHCGGVHQEEEFFDHACPVKSLGVFLELCNEETLLHPFCDLRFTRFLQEYYEGGRVMYIPTNKTNPWVYYYSTAYRTPEDSATYAQFVEQDQASTVVKVRKEDRVEARALVKQMAGGRPKDDELEEMTEFVAGLRQNIEAMLIRHFPDVPMKTGEMKRIAVGQVQGQIFALKLAEKLAREACERFGIRLE
eukprot:TRINITY_DN11655_c0_g1_i1.p1 TRINITY_DN11655_c0_g1~~TRINITY_DN11655_c0_g1_i1.p1  ORF type:complete len:493 (-),score=80.27 TRINITY_DN11655_c0_g1_i1:62-1540(-)